MHHMAGLHMARKKCTISAAIINITCFNCILGRKEKEITSRKKNSNHVKRKIDVPLGQEMDSNNDDD